jgi:3-methylfumaryl-CoA hydratase
VSAIDIEYLKSWIGREKWVEDTMNLFPAHALAGVFDHAATPKHGDRLPASWHWMYFLDTPASADTDTDGHPKKGGFLPPVPLPRRMWAAGELQVRQALMLGRPASKRSSIRSVELKKGKSGALVFVTIDHAIHQDGELCLLEEQSLVYRDMPATLAPLANGDKAPTEVDWEKVILPDPVLLFRYSALTYNCHRIHYDRDYAKQVEFYPGLVVHGPLLATLLLDLVATRVADSRVARFTFRAVRPIFVDAPLKLCGKRNGNQVSLWAVDADGYVGMAATADLVWRA